MEIVAIIVAAGRGVRAGGDVPKQYRMLAGRSVLSHTLDAFLTHAHVDHVLCAIHPDDRDLYDRAVLDAGHSEALLPPVAGGSTRQESVRAALEAVAAAGDPDRLCLVHDAARPLLTSALIDRAIDAGRLHGAAVPGLAVTDTVKEVDDRGRVVATLERSSLRAIQTPQAFALSPLLEAHRAAAREGLTTLTDDGQLMEWLGARVHVFEGEAANVKITRPEDFDAAERHLGREPVPLVTRVGSGFDVHAFGEGDHIWLGGLKIPHTQGVLAHSDGDVVLHALTDALLGAICDGDIGTHFPPSDPVWRGASSDRFLAYASDRVRAAGGRIDHLDATVLCEQPRVGPHREPMRERIAAIAGIPVSFVSVKATTTERLGFTGRGEGIAAQAAATIRVPDPS